MASFCSPSPLLLLYRHPTFLQVESPPTLRNPNPRFLTPLRPRHRRSPWFCRAAPMPPVPEPPSSNDSEPGVQVVLSKVRDRAQIFFAVLFWLSLFFWGSAWDGRDSLRKKKGPWFKK